MKDSFNMVCLSPDLKISKSRAAQCRALMNRNYAPTEEELQNEQFLELNSDTSDMYGLIHARFIRSPEGKYFSNPITLLCLNRIGSRLREVLVRCVRVLSKSLL